MHQTDLDIPLEVFDEGLLRMQQDDLHGAIECWNQVLYTDPRYIDALENRAVARRRISDFVGALHDVNMVIALEPDRPIPYWVRGDIYATQGNYQAAIADYSHLCFHHADVIPIEQVQEALFKWQRELLIQPLPPNSHAITAEVRDLAKEVASTNNYTSLHTAHHATQLFVVRDDSSPLDGSGKVDFTYTEFEAISDPKIQSVSPSTHAEQPSSESHYKLVVTDEPTIDLVAAEPSTLSLTNEPPNSTTRIETAVTLYERKHQTGVSRIAEMEVVDAEFRTLHPIDHVQKAHELANAGNYRAALYEANIALQMNELLADAYVERGAIYFALGATLKAQLDLDRALALQPNTVMALVYRAQVDIVENRLADAIRHIQIAYRFEPQRAEVHLAYGLFCEAEGKYPQAFAAFDHAVKLNGKLAIAHLNRGRLFMKYEMPRKALADFLRTVELQPGNARAYHSIAGIYLARGEYEVGSHYLEQAAQLGHEAAKQMLSGLRLRPTPQPQPSNKQDWRAPTSELLSDALLMLACFAYRQCGLDSWREQVIKKTFMGLGTKQSVETIARWQVNLESSTTIDDDGSAQRSYAASLDLLQTPQSVVRVSLQDSNSYVLAIWAQRQSAVSRNSIFSAGPDDQLVITWSELPDALMNLLTKGILRVEGHKLRYTGKPLQNGF